MDRSYIPLIVVFLVFLSGFSSIAFSAENPEGALATPTRTIYQESENNNDWNSADQLTAQGTYELHGNISSSSDQDFFFIDLNGGNGLVDRFSITMTYMNSSSNTDIIFVIIYGFYPISPTPGVNEIVMDLQYYYNQFPFWTPAFINAAYTGRYGVRLVSQTSSGGPISGSLEYNFTVALSQVSSSDTNNDESDPQTMTSGLISNGLDQNLDLMDWYKVTAPDPLHPTILDMTITPINPTPQLTTGTYHYGIQIDVYIRYNSRSNPGTFTEMIRRISPHPTFQQAGLLPTPYELYLERNCTEIQVGFVMQSFGLDSRNPILSQKQLTTLNANTGLSLDVDISANIPNKRPQLLDAQVDPIMGKSGEIFKFSVTYRDIQNETPRQVNLWMNGQFFKALTKAEGSGNDYAVGVVYETEIIGSQIGPDADYSFNISASDGKDWAVDPESGVGTFYVRIDNNLPPQSVWETKVFTSQEDADTIWVVLELLFSDPEEGMFTYSILDDNGFSWVNEISNDNLHARLINNGTEVAPEWRLKIDLGPDVNGLIPIVVNATDDGAFARSAEVEIILNVEPINDPPHIDRIDSMDRKEFGDYLGDDTDQGDLVEIKVLASDIDVGDVISYHWDIGDVLHNARRGVNYDWNISSGDLWFFTSDGDVPGFETVLIVSDGRGGTDQITIEYDVRNVNDPPTIIVPREKSTIEGEFLYINPIFDDPDLDTGNEVVTFLYTLGALERVTPSSAIEFSQATGRFVLEAAAEEMNGEWEINITIVDMDGEADWGVCKISIGNVNDPPIAFPISVEQEDESLSVVFHTAEAEDEDHGETLTYIWDFGDGSDIQEGVELKDVPHTFPAEGAYTVTLTVFDGEARSEMKELIVTVTAPPPNPDLDGDGMLNEWEIKFGLDPNDPADAGLDMDSDGLTNLEEFQFFDDKGIYINPWNPDSDGDGFDDGEEIANGYDPVNFGSHPEDPNKDLGFLLWLGGLALIVLMLLALTVFIIMRIRNKPKPVAAPAAPTPVYDEMLAPGYYEQIPPPDMAALPPVQSTYDQVAYDQNYYPQQDKAWVQDGVQDLYAPQQVEQYPPAAPMEQIPTEPQAVPPEHYLYGDQESPAADVPEVQNQGPVFDSSLSGIDQEPSVEPPPAGEGSFQEPPEIEQVQETTEEGSIPQEMPIEEAEEQTQEKKKEDTELPPPPLLPDL